MSKFAAPTTPTPLAPSAQRKPRVVEMEWIDGEFVRGPLPMDWFNKAKALGGACVSVGLRLWHFKGMSRGEIFHAGLSQLRLGNESTDTVRRGLKRLEDAGLIEVIRNNGCKHRFRIHTTTSTSNKEQS